MSNQSPFLIFKVECPLCKTINEFELIRVGAYTEDGRDSDFSPRDIKWRYPRYQAYHPLAFFTAMCTHCYYTREFTNKFKDWKSDNHFRSYKLKSVKEGHLEQLSVADSVVKLLGSHVDISRYPNESAILKLLLAIFDEQIPSHFNDLDIGRFYLRVGWVFRKMDKGENPQIVSLKGLLHEIEKSFGSVGGSVDALTSGTDTLSANVRSHFDSDMISADLQARMLSYKERYDEGLAALSAATISAKEAIDAFRALLDEYKTDLLGSDGESSGNKFFKYPSFLDFLSNLRQSWDGIVTSEREALEKAVIHYKKAFADGRNISPGNQQIQASYLIAELSRRIGDYDEAKQYFTSTIKAGQEFVYCHRNDQTKTALARKILELAIEQGRLNLEAAKSA